MNRALKTLIKNKQKVLIWQKKMIKNIHRDLMIINQAKYELNIKAIKKANTRLDNI